MTNEIDLMKLKAKMFDLLVERDKIAKEIEQTNQLLIQVQKGGKKK